jgi:Mn2+/Fe2+ NRAMP family transporter
MKRKFAAGPVTGAAFLMATSAIGPGFLTQTSKFTAELMASFGFIILVSLLLDIGAQLNIWRTLTVSGRRAQDLANELLPGLGWILAGLVAFGGLVFNIGNIAGCGLGLNALTGMPTATGALISCLLALIVFWQKQALAVVDVLVKLLGVLMIGFTLWIVFRSQPPLQQALVQTILPEKIDFKTIVVLVGGTVGGYISFAGAHRLLEAGLTGKASIPKVNSSAVTGLFLTTLMRYILFLAVLGVVSKGLILDASNPAASVFRHAAGEVGYHFFGFVMWCAAITSVIGASFTSISFFTSLHGKVNEHRKLAISIFIITSTAIFLFVGNPVKLLILAGGVNGLILPLALAVILIAVVQKRIVGDYRHPQWLQVIGWLVVIAMAWLGWMTLREQFGKLFMLP